MRYDVVIIGSGPAGLFAGFELAKSNLSIAIVDKDPYSSGGLVNDCKLTLHHEVSMDISKLGLGVEKTKEYIKQVDEKFSQHGPFSKYYGADDEKIIELEKKANQHGIKLIRSPARHVGTDNSLKVREGMKKELEESGVNFLLGTEINEIEKQDKFQLHTNKEKIEANKLIVSPGRGGAYWFLQQAQKLNLNHNVSGPVDIGVRIEMLAEFYKEITDALYDAKFYIKTPRGDRCRTFCTNPNGRLVFDQKSVMYKKKEYKCINGDANMNSKTKNTNFALLNTVTLTRPYTDTFRYGREQVVATYNQGGGKPIIQRMQDFMNNKRSRIEHFNEGEKGLMTPTMKVPDQLSPGDIGWAYRYHVVKNIKYAIETLAKLAPGVKHPSTCLVAPEVKFYTAHYETKNFETNIPGLFVAGDGCGKSRGIVGAAITGILAAKSLMK